MRELTIGKNDAGQRLDRFLSKALPLLPPALAQKYIRIKRVKVNGGRAQRDQRLSAGDVLQLYINDEFFDKPSEENLFLTLFKPHLTVVYEDEHLLLADKPQGMVVHADETEKVNTLINHIQAYLYQKREWNPKWENAFTPALCNRIDRNTGGIVIAAIYLFSAFGIGAAVDVREISVDSGLIDAVSLILGGSGGVLVGVVALLFLVTLFGNMISWSMGVNSTAALAADHNDMPRVFAKRWAKNDMPVGAAVTSGVVASCVCVLGVLIEMASPDSSLFWSFFALNLVMLLLSYLPVFPAFLKLRREDAKTPRPFRVPGSDTALKWIAYVPMVLIVISIIFTAIPLSFDAETLASFLPITIGSILSVAIGEVLIALRGKNARS